MLCSSQTPSLRWKTSYLAFSTLNAMLFLSLPSLRCCTCYLAFSTLDATGGPVNIQTSASDFWGKQIHQTWARVAKKYLNRVNI
jgi:hypothetical protein